MIPSMPKKRPPQPAGDTNIRPRWAARLGQWVFDVTYPRWQRGFRTLPEARRARNAMRADADNGTMTRGPARMTVHDLVIKRWLPSKEAELTNRHSIAGCKRIAALVDEGLGKHELRKLTPLDVEAWKQAMTKRFNSATAAQRFDRLREILGWAVDHELLHRNPARLVKRPKVVEYKVPALDLDQVRTIIEKADATPYGILVWMAMNTGMRVSELLALEWKQVDFGDRSLKTDSKTEAGSRAIALAPATIERLQTHRLNQIAEYRKAQLPPPTLLFLNDRRDPMRPSWWWWRWNGIRGAAGVPELHFHDLRHVHASLMGKARVHPSVMKERLGHTEAAMSIEVYTHTDASQQVEAAEAVEALILGS